MLGLGVGETFGVGQIMRFFALVAALAATIGFANSATSTGSITVVPPDYHAKEQPRIYAGSYVLTTIHDNGGFKEKYAKVYALLSHDKALIGKIKKAAAT